MTNSNGSHSARLTAQKTTAARIVKPNRYNVALPTTKSTGTHRSRSVHIKPHWTGVYLRAALQCGHRKPTLGKGARTIDQTPMSLAQDGQMLPLVLMCSYRLR